MKNRILLASFTALTQAACGGGSAPAPAPAPLPAPVPAPVLKASSYANYKQQGLQPHALPTGDNTMRAYADFTGNGRLDLFRAVITYNAQRPQSEATPSRFEFYARQADGSYLKNTTLLAKPDGCLHPRKPIVADFNGDSRPDMFVACHGYDALPFPGERNKVVLSQADGSYVISDASPDIGFFHGASAVDLNGDGKIDVVAVNNFDPERAMIFLNDGSGHFTREMPSRLPVSIRNGGYFSVELLDINEDGKLDLIMGGHEFESANTVIFLNPGNNDFSKVAAIVVPPVPNEGVVLDFTVTGSGPTRTLWVARTSGGDGTFYQSKVVQKVSYPAMSSSVVLNQRPARWIPWLIPATAAGVPVVASDNAQDAVSIPQ